MSRRGNPIKLTETKRRLTFQIILAENSMSNKKIKKQQKGEKWFLYKVDQAIIMILTTKIKYGKSQNKIKWKKKSEESNKENKNDFFTKLIKR